MRCSRGHVHFVCLLTITWQLLFTLQGVVGLCCQQHDGDHAASKAAGANCPIHGSQASAMAGMKMADGMDMDMGHDATPLCDCARIQCAGGGAGLAVFGPAAILPSIVAIQPLIQAGERPAGPSPAANRLSALPLSPPPRA